MDKDEAFKLALEAMQSYAAAERKGLRICDKAIAAIKAALAQPPLQVQPVQEPVAWGFMNDDGVIYDCISPEAHDDCEGSYNVPLYTTPPQRPWVGLTEEDMRVVMEEESCSYIAGAKWAEEILRGKNT
jgi:hypothetical protein